MEPAVFQIDDVGPMPVVRPQSAAEAGEVVRRAAAEKQALYPFGGQTMLGLGLPPARPGLGVDLRSLAQVIDYPARDMTITVQAGIPLARLQQLLAPENQRLPVDVPRPEQATLGGALATNTSGPHRYGFGTLRDYVIGISTINDEGQEVKAGGRVVKNVAGYDLCKLHIGALGTLGMISQVTLKLRPLPESRALLALGCSAAALEGMLNLLHQTRARPICIEVLNSVAARAVGRTAGIALPEAPWILVVGFEDSSQSVSWQVQQVMGEVPARTVQGLEAWAGNTTEPLWQALVEHLWQPEVRLSFKANLLPSAVAGFCVQAARFSESLRLQAHAGSGIVRGHWYADLTLERVQAMLKDLHTAVQSAHGNLILPQCPTAWKRALPLWGLPRGDAELMLQVIKQLDPRRLFNPGRFLQGI